MYSDPVFCVSLAQAGHLPTRSEEQEDTAGNDKEDEDQTELENVGSKEDLWSFMKLFLNWKIEILGNGKHLVLDKSLVPLLQSCLVILIVLSLLIALCQCTGNSIRLRQ